MTAPSHAGVMLCTLAARRTMARIRRWVGQRSGGVGSACRLGFVLLSAGLVPWLTIRGAPPDGSAWPRYAVTTWTTREGLPSDRVRALLQDRAGFLWIATFSGVARFDGIQFRRYDVGNFAALPNNLVNALFEDHAGRIWFGHETGELTVWSNGRFAAVPIPEVWRGAPVDDFAEDGTGTVWVRNRRNWLLPVRGLSAKPLIRQVGGNAISEIASDAAGALWAVVGNQAGRLELASSDDLRFNPETAVSGRLRPCLCPDRTAGMWIAGATDLRHWQDGRWAGETVSTGGRPRAAMNRWIQTADGGLAIGTIDGGIQLFSRPGTRMQIGTGDGLPAAFVTALLQDREGNFWVGVADQGLCRARPSLVAMVRPTGGSRSQDRAVEAVVQARDGSIWAGTEGAGLIRLKDGEWAQFGAQAGLTNLVVHAVLEDRTGTMWAGLSNGTLGRMSGGHFEPLFTSTELDQLSALFEATDGRLWLGSLHGAAFLAESVPHFVSSDAEPLTHVRCFAETPDRAVWIATLGGGLGRYANGTLKIFRRPDGLPSDYLWSLRATTDGTLWIGTYDRGLAWYREGRFHRLGTAEGLPGNMVGQILEADDGALWVGTNGGIARIARSELQAYEEGRRDRVAVASFGVTDGLSTLGLTGGRQAAACRAQDGSLWFATHDGLARLDPHISKPDEPAPPALIEAVRIDGVETPLANLPAGGVLSVPAGSRRLEIDYTGMSLSAPDRIRFRYQLDGVDAGWTDAETRRTAYFAYLRPGDYAFKVVATRDNGGHSSAPATLRLHVNPNFWETLWFRAAAVAAALLLVAGGVTLVLRGRHRRRIEQLERARAVEHERTRIAHDLHDKVGSGLTEISFLSHSALASSDVPALVASLRDIQSATTEMTQAIDEIVWAVNPRHDSVEGLVSYLGSSVQEFAQHTGLRCQIDIPIDEQNLRLAPEVRHNVFLAVREALNNVAKHAAATEVSFTVRRDGRDLVLVLSDNGRGLSRDQTPAPAGGVGLESMAQRLGRVGGSVRWADRPGGGTVITLQLPLPVEASPEVGT